MIGANFPVEIALDVQKISHRTKRNTNAIGRPIQNRKHFHALPKNLEKQKDELFERPKGNSTRGRTYYDDNITLYIIYIYIYEKRGVFFFCYLESLDALDDV